MSKRKSEDANLHQSKLSFPRKAPGVSASKRVPARLEQPKHLDQSDHRGRGRAESSNSLDDAIFRHPISSEKCDNTVNDCSDTTKRSSDVVEPEPKSRHFITLNEEAGDVFASPRNSVLIHACNCEGHWGAGIAKAFKDRYPNAFSIYNEFCRKSKQADLPGTALLISLQDDSKHQGERDAGHYIGCLFTSRSKGKMKSNPATILASTGPAMLDLLSHIAETDRKGDQSVKISGLYMCKINSGLFNVPWKKTKAVLTELEVEEDVDITVVEKD